jgi:AraC-like DNA-binding protein
MMHRHYRAHRPLSDHVELLWLLDRSAPSHGSERALPTGTVELVIDLGGSGAGFDAIVCGPYSRFFVIDTSQPTTVMGAHFRPGGMAALLGLPVDELHNLNVSLDALWGHRAVELRERLLATPAVEAKFRLLERVLSEWLDRQHRHHAAVDHALRAFARGTRRIGDVVDETGLSPRRFIRLFRDSVGLTPKAFCRVQRFQRAVALLHDATDVEWAETAVACGYYDQSHMINDFQDFAGLSPASYLARRGTHMNHVPQ